MERVDGIINLDKPAGISSAAAVNRVKWLLPRGTRVGHAGTLDPFATGVLLILVGKATKFSQLFMDQPKKYQAVVKLGATTPTDDSDAPEETVPGAVPPTPRQIDAVVAGMIGIIEQLPPQFSAKKVGGRRAYELARKGKEAAVQPQRVRIDAMEIISYQWPLLRLKIDCGRGTYIRAIARDLGKQLNVGGYLTELRRTRIGKFDVADGVDLSRLAEDGIAKCLHTIESIQ
jgi:tRNA pseudouridine55 synthase